MKIKIFITTLLVLFAIMSSHAQDVLEQDTTVIDPHVHKAYIFQHLDDSQLDPPLLWDRGATMVNLALFDGTDHPDRVADTRTFGYAYGSVLTIPTDDANRLTMPLPAYSTEMQNLSSTDAIPIMALHCDYHRLNPTALGDGLIYEDDNQFKESVGNTIPVFEPITAFLAVPMLRVIERQDPSFVLKSQHYFGNTDKTLSSGEVDFGNGAGWQTLALDAPVLVNYNTPGKKTLRIRYHFSDGTAMENRASVDVRFDLVAPGQPLSGNFTNVHATSDPYNGAQVDIWIEYNCASAGLKKPLIFVEGFNPEVFDNLGPDRWYDNINQGFPSFGNLENMIDLEGYDLIYIDYHDGGTYIQHNAAALREAIAWINAEKAANGSTEPNVVVGSSMGGLVSKYALRTMELAGIDHETELFVAFDSPMQGANIPIGAQCAARHIPNINLTVIELGDLDEILEAINNGVEFFLDLLPIHNIVNVFNNVFGTNLSVVEVTIDQLIPELRIGEQALNLPAVRQMLVLQASGFENTEPNLHLSFMAEFNGLGDLVNAREIAISNGSQVQQGQPYPPHTNLFHGNFLPTYAPLIFTGTSSIVLIDILALAEESNQYKRVYNGLFFQSLGGFIVTFSSEARWYRNTPSYDTAPGGHYDFGEATEDYEGFGQMMPSIVRIVLGVDFEDIEEETFCFIPVTSSIAYDGPNGLDADLSDNLARVTDGSTHFKNYIGETSLDGGGFANHEHEMVSEHNGRLMRYEMTGKDRNLGVNLLGDFNFGKSNRDGVDFLTADHWRTTDRITRDIIVNNEKLNVNCSGRIAQQSNPNNPTNLGGTHFDLRVIDTECSNGLETNVVIDDGAIFKIGDASVNNTADVYFSSNSALEVLAGGTLFIDPNSRVIIEQDALLNLNGGSIVIAQGADLIIKSGATLKDLNGTIRIADGGRLLIETGGVMDYRGGDIVLNGNQAELALQGRIKISGGVTFKPIYESGYQSGFIHILDDGAFPEWHFESVGTGNKLRFEGAGKDDLILLVDPGAEFRTDNTTDYFESCIFRDGWISLSGNARVQLDSYYNSYTNIRQTGSSRGVIAYDKFLVVNSEFESASDLNCKFIYRGGSNLKVIGTFFGDDSNVEIEGGYFRFSNCTFERGYITSTANKKPSSIKSSDFSLVRNIESYLNASTLRLEENTFHVEPPNASSMNFDDGYIYNEGGNLELRCNTFSNYKVEVSETKLWMNSGNHSGYNTMEGRQGLYVTIGYPSSELYLIKGYNTFYESRNQLQFRYIGGGTPNSPNIELDAADNYWQKELNPVIDYDEGPVAARLEYKNISPPFTGPVVFIDEIDNVVTQCGALAKNMAIGPPKGGKLDRATTAQILELKHTLSSSMSKSNQADPIITTALIDSVPLSEAYIYATEMTEFYNDSTGNDLYAIDLLSDILLYDYDSLAQDVAWITDLAFVQLKTAVEHAFSTDTLLVGDNVTAFHPSVQSYVDVLMHRTADVVNDSNYVSQFYLEIDKAQLFNLLDKQDMCWQLLENLDNCPLDSTEQAYLNRWLSTIGQQILDVQAGLSAEGIDSLTSTIDTTQFINPSPVAANQFYFGAQILGVNLVTYTNCGLVDWKSLKRQINEHFNIYPNPSQGLVAISSLEPIKGRLALLVYDQAGRQVQQHALNLEKGAQEIDISALARGTYQMLIMQGEKQLHVGKVILNY